MDRSLPYRKNFGLALIAGLLSCYIAHQAGAQTDYDKLVQMRMQEQLKWLEENPWPKPSEKVDWKLKHAYVVAFNDNKKAKQLNDAIVEYCKSYKLDPKKAPHAYKDPRPQPVLYKAYLKPQFHKLLTRESKDAIADACWRWVYRHSFISPKVKWPLNNPKKSIWFISGSENHCAAQRSANLLSLQVLLKAGKADAKLHDGFTVAAHYREWVRWFCNFYPSRMREGLTCEIAHPSSYGLATITHCYEIEELTDSKELKQAARDFLTVFWANVACEFEPRTNIRASIAYTRCYKWSWTQSGSLYWARSILYAYGWSDVKATPNLTHLSLFTGTYRPPAILRAIARDKNRKPYMGTSRRFGRGTGWDKGVYQVVFDDGAARNSYMRRDTWYTTAYTMSALSLDPGRDYIELVDQSRVMGVQFSSDVDDRVVVYAGNTPAVEKVEYKMTTSRGVNGVLGPDCLIVARDPNAAPKTTNSTRVFVSDGSLWDNRQESDGWFFTHAGDGYAAIRIHGGYKVVQNPYKNGYFLEFKDIWTPVVIQMGQAKDYENSMAAFEKAVKAKTLTYDKGKLTYKALSGDTYDYWSKSKTIPKINGKTINLNPEMTYDFPYLKMKHGENQATISYPGYPDLVVPVGKRSNRSKKEQNMGITIGLIGDSTVAVQSGWGPAFAERFKGKAEVVNCAKNGGFLDSMNKYLEKLLKDKPDYVLIQFGHNDQKRYDTEAYSQKLRSYIKRIHKAGGKPIILSSVVRRSFDENGKIVSRNHDAYKANLTAYADAARDVAKDMNLPFIDLHRISEAHHNEIGRKESMTYNFKEGDRTHFNKKGGAAIAGLVLKELRTVVPELSEP